MFNEACWRHLLKCTANSDPANGPLCSMWRHAVADCRLIRSQSVFVHNARNSLTRASLVGATKPRPFAHELARPSIAYSIVLQTRVGLGKVTILRPNWVLHVLTSSTKRLEPLLTYLPKEWSLRIFTLIYCEVIFIGDSITSWGLAYIRRSNAATMRILGNMQ